MAGKIFTPERLARLLDQLRTHRNERFAGGDKRAAGQALGMGGEWSLGVALVMECWPEKLRPLMAGIIGAAANVGYALIGVVTWVFPVRPDSWRWVMLAGATPALLALFVSLFVPESQRWKASVKQRVVHPLREVFGRGLAGTTLLAIAFAAIALIGTWGSVQWLPLWADQLAGKSLPQVKGMTMFTMSVGAIVGCFIGPWIGARLGRRTAYCALCTASLISCLGQKKRKIKVSPTVSWTRP